MEIKKYLDQEGVKHLWSKISMEDYPNNETLMAVINAIDETKADAEHTHTYESVEGLEDVIGNIADAKFYVVTFERGDDNKYHADLTFAEIREKFEGGGNMVARIDGTDYIPLLSAAPHQIIFSGIYNTQSVSLTINANEVCTLTTTQLSNSSHSHSTASTTTSGFMSKDDKTKLNSIETNAEVNIIKSISVNGEELVITDKTVDISERVIVPRVRISHLPPPSFRGNFIKEASMERRIFFFSPKSPMKEK